MPTETYSHPRAYPGTPRLNWTTDTRGKLVQRTQTPVYATESEARISGSGWLYWTDPAWP